MRGKEKSKLKRRTGLALRLYHCHNSVIFRPRVDDLTTVESVEWDGPTEDGSNTVLGAPVQIVLVVFERPTVMTVF